MFYLRYCRRKCRDIHAKYNNNKNNIMIVIIVNSYKFLSIQNISCFKIQVVSCPIFCTISSIKTVTCRERCRDRKSDGQRREEGGYIGGRERVVGKREGERDERERRKKMMTKTYIYIQVQELVTKISVVKAPRIVDGSTGMWGQSSCR